MQRFAPAFAVLLTCLAASPVFSQRRPAAPVPRSDRAPERLVDVGTEARGMFDAARTSNWTEAETRLQSMRDAIESLPRRLSDAPLQRQLRTEFRAVSLDVRDRRQLPAMRHANALTRVIVELASKYNGGPPAVIGLLSYDGRQLELAAMAKRPAQIRRAVDDLHTAWREVEPMLLQRGNADEARRFTDIVVQLDGERNASTIASTATAELAEADRVAQALTARP